MMHDGPARRAATCVDNWPHWTVIPSWLAELRPAFIPNVRPFTRFLSAIAIQSPESIENSNNIPNQKQNRVPLPIMASQTIVISPYSHEVYHTVTPPSLHAARDLFISTNAQDAINTTIRDCFLRHKVETQFSACVNHRHFDIRPNERNIELDGQATASSDLDNIYACSWLFHNGRLYPYEFKRLAPGQSIPEPPQDFIDELGHILEQKGLCDIIGLQSYTDGVVGVESTDHDTQVSTTVDHDDSFDPSRHRGKIQMASFAFF